MYGIGGTDEWERLFEASRNQQESPQLMQGLLGSTGEPNHSLNEIISNGKNKAAQLGQFAQTVNPAAGNDLLAQQQASTQQAVAQQQQQDAQNRQGLMKLAMMFLGGGIGKWRL